MPVTKLTGTVKSISEEPAAEAGKKRLTLILIVDDSEVVEGLINENEELDIELPSRPQP